MSRLVRHLLCTVVVIAAGAGAAGAQLLGQLSLPPVSVPAPLGGVPVAGPVLQDVLGSPQVQQQVVRPTLDTVQGLPQAVAEAGSSTLAELRKMRLQELIRENRDVLEADDRGQPARRGVLIVVDPDPASVQLAVRAGFAIAGQDVEPALGMRVVKLAVPSRMNLREAIRLVRTAAPQLQVDYDHVFEPAGGSLIPLDATLASVAGAGNGRVVGMIDGGVASHPSLGATAIEQNGFAGAPKPTGHGTAVASLLVGNQGPFRGAANGAKLYVADVYGGSRAAGSASAIVPALGWLASHRTQVINISLVGPQNAIVARAIDAVQRRGIQVVAAVGNDGPAAPPQYPASYAGVIAVTAVDARGRALPEAGKATHVDFAAPGADMAAALPGQGYARVRGTSFAAPLTSGRLLLTGSPDRLATEARRGSGHIGRGIVCFDCRVDPRIVGAK
jgi:subtilase family protein